MTDRRRRENPGRVDPRAAGATLDQPDPLFDGIAELGELAARNLGR